ncbi:MAG: amidohydrolase [Rhodospirillaceae bacterium]|nr:amidohydrolase [Rhodospirillaceae bacterium]
MRIDVHAHIVERDYVEALTRLAGLTAERTADGKTLLRRNGFTMAWSRPDMFDIDHRLREMDRKGIDVRILSLSTPNVYPWDGDDQVRMARTCNDAMARLCRAHPDRFVGLGSLPLKNPEAALVEFDRCIDDLGMKGFMIGSNVDGMAMNDPRLEPIWARLNARRIPVFEHPMFPRDTSDLGEFELPLRVGLVFDTTLAATRMIYGGVFERYPDFPYIMGHTGGALLTILERLDNGYKLFPDCRKFISRPPSEFAKSLYYDTCAFYAPALRMAIESVGTSQLLFGTDDPYIDADTKHVERLNLAAADQAAILGGNAARIFGLKG